jgi:hypothetical protein
MKKFTFLLMLAGISFSLNAQDAVVSATKSNVLYLGIDNPVEIAVPGIASDKVTATVDNGTIARTKSGWTIRLAYLKDCNVTVYAGNKKIADKTFRARTIPVPVATFAGINSGVVSKEAVLKNQILETKFPDSDFTMNLEIVSFTMFTASGRELTAKGNALTDEMKSQLLLLTKGRALAFKDIKVRFPEGTIKDLNPIILKID